ncbi:MAG TPA: dihydrolipoamide acetyltransferase family protein [Myxococcota bacterium]|nr:dihydrolipoamide acetyltransferase family protein [Myxococcota bacterium]
MAISVTMPQMGESVVEGTLERWLVREGERVEKDQVLCEITTDKVDAEVVAPEAGVVTKLAVAQGQTVPVGAELALLEPAGGASAAPTRPGVTPAPAPAPAPAADAERPVAPTAPLSRVSPVARRVAEDRGIDLGSLQGSGVGGRVMKADVTARAEAPPAPSPAPAAAARPAAAAAPAAGTLGEFLAQLRVPTHRIAPEDKVIPFTAIRRRIAEHMVVSKVVSPHVGTVAEVDLSRLARLRDRTKKDFERAHGFGLSYLPFVVAATVRGLREFPRMNSAVVGDAIVERAGIHVGVAVETERGLLVPVIRDTDRLSLVGIAEAIDGLARRARDRTISADELAGGSFTVSNPGREGNLYGFAVINQPQVGILRMGEVKKRAVVVESAGEDTIAIRPMMYLALSYDHRIIDGVTGNSFLYRVARALEAAEFEL